MAPPEQPPARFRGPPHRWVLLGLFLAHLAVNWAWWGEDRELVWLDESWHLIDYQYAHSMLVHNGPVGLLRWLGNYNISHDNPFWPLTRTVPGALLARVIEPSWVAHRLLSTLFLGPLLLGVYLLGRRFWSRNEGLYEAAIT